MLKKVANIEIHGKKIEYLFKTFSSSKSIRLIINAEGRLVVTAPRRISERYIRSFIVKKADWIMSALERFSALPKKILGGSRKEYLVYKEQARTLVTERLEHFNALYAFKYKNIAIRNQKTRWGSCSRKGNLNFNYKLALLAPRFADYIIVHELCHLEEFNHSAKFWKLVERAIPDYRLLRSELRKKSSLHF